MSSFSCTKCNFNTSRSFQFERHLNSAAHRQLNFLMSENFNDNDTDPDSGSQTQFTDIDLTSTPSTGLFTPEPEEMCDVSASAPDYSFQENLSISDVSQENTNSTLESTCPWYPFESKAEMLLYVFMNSTTHAVSEEIVKFVLFMMEQLGVTDIPSIQKIKKRKFGNYCWEDLIGKTTTEENIPVWSLKPSQIIKMNLAHPTISKTLIRKADTSSIIKHPSNGKKWIEDLNFDVGGDNLPSVTVPVNLFMDDTSTHKSRRWMPLHCIQMQLAGLPLKSRQKQGTIQFLGASEKTGIMDVAKGIVDDVKETGITGIETFDAANNQKCLVKPVVGSIIADFNMLSYCCNHLGASANKYCPRCYADADHFSSIGLGRTPEDTKLIINRIELRSSIKDKKNLRKKKGVKEHQNVLWDTLNPHRDIPVGLLHLLPLGLTKHLIQYIFDKIDENVKGKLMHHLLSIYPGAQFIDFDKHLASRQGKDFKEYIAPINMNYAGVPRKYIELVTSLALIQKKLNQESFSIDDINGIREIIRDYHQNLHRYAPELTRKVKTHLLLHMVEDIERHGPPVCYVEDGFEKNHGSIRNILFNQNQKARSRDTCVKYAQQFMCTHVITGGYFETDAKWVQASSKVISLAKTSQISNFLGLKQQENQFTAGNISVLKRDGNGHPVAEARDEDEFLKAAISLRIDTTIGDFVVKRGSAVTAQSGALIRSGQWVKYLNENNTVCYGIFKEGIQIVPKRGSIKLMVSVSKSVLTNEKEAGCPVLQLLTTKDFVPSASVINHCYIVHNCKAAGCRPVEGYKPERVEQEDIFRQTIVFKHRLAHNFYIVNQYQL